MADHRLPRPAHGGEHKGGCVGEGPQPLWARFCNSVVPVIPGPRERNPESRAVRLQNRARSGLGWPETPSISVPAGCGPNERRQFPLTPLWIPGSAAPPRNDGASGSLAQNPICKSAASGRERFLWSSSSRPATRRERSVIWNPAGYFKSEERKARAQAILMNHNLELLRVSAYVLGDDFKVQR